jgi:HAD superfamily hydrolase (TIGR01509 family)
MKDLPLSRRASRFSCFIFDMDGTLTRTNELIFASFNHVAQKYLGKVFTPPEIIALFGPPEEGALRKIFGSDRVPTVMDELCEFYRLHHNALASLHPGVDEILCYLKAHGVKLALFTGKGTRTATITLEAFHLSQFFDLVVSGNDVANHKPHPEGILKVLETFHVRPEEVLMVGDSLTDIKASRAAGVRVASVLWDSYDRERVLQAKAEFVFHTVDEMLAWCRTNINQERQ